MHGELETFLDNHIPQNDQLAALLEPYQIYFCHNTPLLMIGQDRSLAREYYDKSLGNFADLVDNKGGL